MASSQSTSTKEYIQIELLTTLKIIQNKSVNSMDEAYDESIPSISIKLECFVYIVKYDCLNYRCHLQFRIFKLRCVEILTLRNLSD